MKRENQNEAVLRLFKRKKVWSSYELDDECRAMGIRRSGARVWDLKQIGHEIKGSQDGQYYLYTYLGFNPSPQLSLL